MKFTCFILLICSVQNALAGQCHYISKIQADKALAILESHKDKSALFVIDQYCESCMDSYPKPILVDSFSVQKHRMKNIFEISINTNTIDAAYTYVDGSNLATLIGCKTVAVSKYLD